MQSTVTSPRGLSGSNMKLRNVMSAKGRMTLSRRYDIR